MASLKGTYPHDLESEAGEYPHYVTFTALQKGTALGTVALYLPADALKSSYTQSYGDADFGAVGVALANQAGGRAGAILDSAMRGVSIKNPIDSLRGLVSGIGGAAGQLNLDPAMRQAALNELMKKAETAFGGAVSALKKVKGEIVNPHKAVIYTGPGGFRTFTFNYVMSPENAKEARTIKNIVHFFKYHMHPGTPTFNDSVTTPGHMDESLGWTAAKTTTTKMGGDINTSMSLTYPEEFNIKMFVNRHHEESKSTPLFRMKNCFLESLNVDYTTSGGAAFITAGGTSVPATTTMAMSFKETVLMTKNSVEQGF